MYLQAIPRDYFAETGEGSVYRPKGTHEHHNVATAAYKLGTRIPYYNATLGGWGECIYLKFSTGAGSVALVPGYACGVDLTAATHYQVTADRSDACPGGPVVFAITAMTDNYYGWFWSKGVCPDCKVLVSTTETQFADVTVATDGSIAKGESFMLHATTDGGIDSDGGATVPPFGFTLEDDSSGSTLAMSKLYLYGTW